MLMAVTDETFQDEVMASTLPVIVDFWAEWCGPCFGLEKTLAELAPEVAGKVKLVKIDVEENIETATTFRARSLPLLLFINNGQVVHQIVGAVAKDKIRAAIASHF